jgi:hypothetical protein
MRGRGGTAAASASAVRVKKAVAVQGLGAMGGEGMGGRALLGGDRLSLSAAPARSAAGRGGRGGAVTVRAVTGPRETRLGSILTTLPQRLDLYFKVRRGRRFLWKAIAAFTGFYTANVISLTFGVLGINDVVAGAFCVGFSELVTRAYYRKATKPGLYFTMLNWFKIGLIYALTTDAFKLGS